MKLTGNTLALCLLCVCAHVRVREYMLSRVSLFVCVCVYVCVRVCVSISVCMHVRLCVCGAQVRACLYLCVFICVHELFLSFICPFQHVDTLTDNN